MLTSQDVLDLSNALNAYVGAGSMAPSRRDEIVDKLIALIPSQPSGPVIHCVRCGRQQGDPNNANCDMQPCTFA
jgi:hypothetical protein